MVGELEEALDDANRLETDDGAEDEDELEGDGSEAF
jgi:hypothetical protein